jgi:hypothetical protein
MTLAERARSVRSREDLVAFLEALAADFTANRGTWTNTDLSSFLDAMAAWSEDMDGFYATGGEDLATVPPWRVLADILMAARIYE